MRENLFHASFLAFGGLLAIFDIPWLVNLSPQSLPSSSYGVLPICVCIPNIPLFVKDIKNGSHIELGTHITPA